MQLVQQSMNTNLAVMIDDVKIEEWGALYPAKYCRQASRAKLHHVEDQSNTKSKDISQQILGSFLIRSLRSSGCPERSVHMMYGERVVN